MQNIDDSYFLIDAKCIFKYTNYVFILPIDLNLFPHTVK